MLIARSWPHQPGPKVEPEPSLTVPPIRSEAPPWTDRVLDGVHGRIAFRETTGSGLPIVLIHGLCASKEAFAQQMTGALGARYRMIAVDLPGHGASDNARDPDSTYTMTGCADAVVELVEHLGLTRFVVLGWSVGGHIALEVAASTPGVVGVALIGTPLAGTAADDAASGRDAGAFFALADRAVLSESELGTLANLSGFGGDPDLLAAARRADARARTGLAYDRAPAAEDIVANLAVPLAVLGGADDPIVAPAALQALSYRFFWENRVHAFPQAGHAPFIDAPVVFNATLARFMRDVERAPAAATLGLCLGG